MSLGGGGGSEPEVYNSLVSYFNLKSTNVLQSRIWEQCIMGNYCPSGAADETKNSKSRFFFKLTTHLWGTVRICLLFYRQDSRKFNLNWALLSDDLILFHTSVLDIWAALNWAFQMS